MKSKRSVCFFIRLVSMSILTNMILYPDLIAGQETMTVEQRDWPDYFPDIPRKASVYESEFERVDMSYITPHTPWAKPYYGGKIKALIVAARVAHRDTVELAQRLDMEFDTICAFSRMKIGGSDTGRYDMPVGCTEAEQRLKLAGLLKKDYDVIIVGKMNANAVPDDLQERIREKVTAGAGLVFSYFDGDESAFVPVWARAAQPCPIGEAEELCFGVPFGAVDAWQEYKTPKEAAGKILTLKTLGKGKIAIIKVGGNACRSYLAPAGFKEEIKLWPVDYYMSLAARVTAWAAGKAPLGRVECKVTGQVITAEIAGMSGRWNEVEFKVRDEWGDNVFRKYGSEATARLPELANGKYVADAIVKKGGRTINWASTAFKIEKAHWIKSLEASPKGIKPNEEFTVKVKLNTAMKEKGVLNVQAEDMRGRLLVMRKGEIVAGRDEIEIKGKLDDPMSNLVRIRANLHIGKQLVSKEEAWLPVNLSYPADDFGFVCWDLASPEYNWHYARAELAKLGVDSSYGGANYQKAWLPATAGFHTIPYMTRYAISRSTPGPRHECVPCLSDPEYIKKEQEKIKKSAEQMSMFGAAGYSLGDENDLSLNDHEVCFSSSCRAAFRDYVRKAYGDNLDAVNAEWGVTNAAWEEIEPMPLWEAREKKQPARWVDFRMSMEDVFLRIHQLGSETTKNVDKNALVGFDGGFDITSFTGYDWWKLSRILDVWGIYPDHLQAEILRSFHRPSARTGRWYGGYYNITRFTEYAHWEPWYDLFHEMNNVWWFNIIGTDGGGPQAEDTMNPASFKPFPILAATAAETREIKSGIGKLLMGCRRDSDGIAILYSQASLHAATFYGMNHKPMDSQRDFIKVLEDLGYNYRFVSYAQVQDGILDREKYRLLILPCAVALSKGEREQIKAFMDNGGQAMADDIPGIYDDHGKEILDDAWRSFINGKVNVIGAIIRNYQRHAPYAEAMQRYLIEKLHGMGIEPKVMIKTKDNAVYEGELAVFTDGNIKYVGLLRDHSPKKIKQRVSMLLPGKFHVYDVRKKRHLGFQQEIGAELEAGEAGLWALLGAKPGKMQIESDRQESAQGGRVKCRISLQTEGRHVVRFEVFNPDGNLVPWYSRNVNLMEEKADAIIPFAQNDPRGKWQFKATDVATGSSAVLFYNR